MTASTPSYSSAPHRSSGGRLVALDGRPVALEGTELRADASCGLARVVLEQRFRNVHPEALRATYQVPLPPDAAVSAYAFRIGSRRIVGEVDRCKAARERFEEALIEGRTAALLEQDRTSLFTQEIGNIPPGAAVVAEIAIDQRLRWLDEGSWEWRFPTAVAPRYPGDVSATPEAMRVVVDVADPEGVPLAARATLRLTIGDELGEGGAVSSPSHAVSVESGAGAKVVTLADGAARLDRDLVVRWPVARARTRIALAIGRPAAGRLQVASSFGLATVVPPLPEARGASLPRDLVALLDTSGSMSGEPLEQAKAVVRSLIESLSEADRMELIEFSTTPRRWRRGPVDATEHARREAIKWVSNLRASGGTEMASGIVEALANAREGSQRQVVLVSDGLVGFEERVVGEILRRLPSATRVHTVGVGSCVNRSLTSAAARAGRGVEVVIGLGEETAPAVARVLARMRQPLVTQLEASGSALLDHAPASLPDLFAGAPVLVSLRLRVEGGSLVVRGRRPEGAWEERVDVPPMEAATGSAAVVSLYARERVEDLETRVAAGEHDGLDAEIERLGLDFQIATRLTSWVAVAEEASVDPSEPIRREFIPHELAYGVSAEGLGLRRAQLHSGLFVLTPTRLRPTDARSRGRLGSSTSVMRRFVPGRAAPPPPSPLDLIGRILVRRARLLIVEITRDEGFVWLPQARLSVVLSDGRRLAAVVDTARTTRSGECQAGQSVRLALELAEELGSDEPREILLENAGVPLRIRIEG